MNPKTIKLSRRGILLAVLAGLFASAYLLYTYTTGADLKCGSFVHGCDAVRLSEWASVFGIPTPVFGVIFYLSVLIILIVRAYSPNFKPKLARLAQIVFGIAGFAESIFLTYIQRFVIEQYCTWCLVSAVAATVIFLFTFLDREYELQKAESIKELKFIAMSLSGFVILGGLAFFWLVQPVKAPPLSSEFIQGRIESLEPSTESAISNEGTARETIIALGSHTETLGPEDAEVTIIEFLDYECPACAIYHADVIKPIRDKYQGRIRYAIRHFPLPEIHPNALGASLAAVCAGAQGKFFEMSDQMLANQSKLSRADLEATAVNLGIELELFTACVDSDSALSIVLADRDAGRELGVTGTPTIIINNEYVDGNPDMETLSELIEARLK